MLLQGDTVEVLGKLPAGIAQCCVTSPPYWGLRDYGLPPTQWPEVAFTPMAGLPPVTVPAWSGCLGLEPEPMAFVAHLVCVFREVRRVLADDGTLWLNLGDSYAATTRGSSGRGEKQISNKGTLLADRKSSIPRGLKPKDLIGIPWRVALALQAAGWYLRSDVIWAKPNPMPESVTDRPTKAHEYVFLLTKSERYFYDADAVREPMVHPDLARRAGKTTTPNVDRKSDYQKASGRNDGGPHISGAGFKSDPDAGRNARSVWTIPSQPYRGAHFATMPRALAERCLLAGSAPGQLVLDPFNGAATTGVAALTHGRRYLGIDLNADYIQLSAERLTQVKR